MGHGIHEASATAMLVEGCTGSCIVAAEVCTEACTEAEGNDCLQAVETPRQVSDQRAIEREMVHLTYDVGAGRTGNLTMTLELSDAFINVYHYYNSAIIIIALEYAPLESDLVGNRFHVICIVPS